MLKGAGACLGRRMSGEGHVWGGAMFAEGPCLGRGHVWGGACEYSYSLL